MFLRGPRRRCNNTVPTSRRDLVYFILSGFFLTNAVLGELTGGKLFAMPALDWGWLRIPSVVLPIGVIPWPIVFVSTDLVNEYYGRAGVRRLTFLAVSMIGYSFLILFLTMLVPAWERSPVAADVYRNVFGQSMWIIVGSLTAFLISQFVDVSVFHIVKDRTGHRLLWARATGSTFVSQLVDTFIVQFIGLYLAGVLTGEQYLRGACLSYVYKVLVAALITPLIYLAHNLIDRFIGRKTAREMERRAATL